MPVNVTTLPVPASLRRMNVGLPVSAGHGRRWANMESFLLGHALEYIAQKRLPHVGAVTPVSAYFAYARSPSAQILGVTLEAHDSPTTAGQFTATVVRSGSGTGTWVGPSAFDGATTLTGEPPSMRDHAYRSAWMNVSAMTPGTIEDIVVTSAIIGNGGAVQRVGLLEVPLASIDPVGDPANEPGFNEVWPAAHNRLVAGSAGDSLGFKRVVSQFDNMRSGVRRHWQWVTWEDVTLSARCVSAVFAAGSLLLRQDADWLAGFEPIFYMRARRVRTTATPNPYTFRVRYITNDNANAGALRLIINGVNNDLALPPTNNVWKVATGTASVPTSTANQDVAIEPQAKIAGGAVLNVSQIALVELEP